jgi:nucleoside-diphosphate-sugar epimerase
MQSVLITGANGFIGSNLCRYFLDKGYYVYGLVRKTSDLHFLDGQNVRLIYGDLNEVGGIEWPQNLDVLIHCASVVSDVADDACCESNIYNSTINLVHHIKNHSIDLKKFIFMSSALVLGYGKLNISETNPGMSAEHMPYVRCKKKTEEKLLHMHNGNDLPVVILRPADVFGPNDRVTCAHLLKGIDDGVPIIVGSGKWVFPYCYVDNLCQATYLACQSKNSEGNTYTVTNGTDVTWKDMLSFFQNKLKKKQWLYIPVFFPHVLAFVMKILQGIIPSYESPLTSYRIKRVTSHTNYDISKTIEELNYVPESDIEKQFSSIVDWYLAEKDLGYIK